MRAARPSSGSASLVTRPGPLQPLDQLSHRRLADPFLGGQRRKPNGPFTAHPVHRKRSGRAQIGAVTQKPRGQVQCLIEKLADAVAGVFIGRPISHPVSISCDLYSGNRSRASAQHNRHFTGLAALSRHSPEGACARRADQSAVSATTPPKAPSRTTTVTDTGYQPGTRAVATQPIPPPCPHYAASRRAVRGRLLDRASS